jgi:predicted membrane protein
MKKEKLISWIIFIAIVLVAVVLTAIVFKIVPYWLIVVMIFAKFFYNEYKRKNKTEDKNKE